MKTLLIIDDDEMMLNALTILFQNEDYTIVSSSDGRKGIELYDKHRPNAVLLDLNMPGIHGFDVLDEIKKIDQHAKVIIVTGYGSPETIEESVRKGAFAFYDKSTDVEKLQEQVERAVEAGTKDVQPQA